MRAHSTATWHTVHTQSASRINIVCSGQKRPHLSHSSSAIAYPSICREMRLGWGVRDFSGLSGLSGLSGIFWTFLDFSGLWTLWTLYFLDFLDSGLLGLPGLSELPGLPELRLPTLLDSQSKASTLIAIAIANVAGFDLKALFFFLCARGKRSALSLRNHGEFDNTRFRRHQQHEQPHPVNVGRPPAHAWSPQQCGRNRRPAFGTGNRPAKIRHSRAGRRLGAWNGSAADARRPRSVAARRQRRRC